MHADGNEIMSPAKKRLAIGALLGLLVVVLLEVWRVLGSGPEATSGEGAEFRLFLATFVLGSPTSFIVPFLEMITDRVGPGLHPRYLLLAAVVANWAMLGWVSAFGQKR